MSWHRAAVIVACGFLLQCTSSVNTSNQQSYREALRRRLSTVAWRPPAQPSPCVVVPYPYLQTICPNPRVHSATNNIITQNTGKGWPEYRIQLPLCMGQSIKTNIIIELPLCMFPQPQPAGGVNNAAPSSSSSTDPHGSQSVEEDKTSKLPAEHVNKPADMAECSPDEIIENTSLVPKEGNTFKKNINESPCDKTTDNGSSTDKSEAPCDNDSPSPPTNDIENMKTVSEPRPVSSVSNPGEADKCINVPNEPVKTAPDNAPKDSHSIDNSPESISASPDACELTSHNEPSAANNEKTSDDTPTPNAAEKETPSEKVTQNDGAIEPQPQTKDGADSEFSKVDDTEKTYYTEDDTKTEKLLKPYPEMPQPEDVTTVPEDAAECSTSRTDNGTEIASSAGSEATPSD